MLRKHYWLVAVIGLVLLLFLINNSLRLFALHPFTYTADGDIKVMCMNIHSVGENFNTRSKGIYELVNKESPDFVYLTEYHDTCNAWLDSTLCKKDTYNARGIKYDYIQNKSIGLRDAWWDGGFGLGNTFGGVFWGLRIDHILYSSGLELADVKHGHTGLSDHRALISSFIITNNH